MKYCPYCGVTILGSAVSFCAECGKVLPFVAEAPDRKRETPMKPTYSKKPPEPIRKPPPLIRRAPERSLPPARMAPSPRSIFPQRPSKKQPERKPIHKPDPRDEDYDGYYDDVKPIDDGHVRERIDHGFVMRIVYIASGAIAIVILSVIIMYLL